MPDPPDLPDPPLPELRASDTDREHAVDVLQRAASDGQLSVDELEERVTSAYGALTRKELEQLTADVSPVPSQPAGLKVSEGPGGDRWVISVMSGHDKQGRWRLAPRCTVLNIMGGSGIDLNDAELSQPVTEINMYSIMGGGEIRVPHGVEVHVSNFAFMGQRRRARRRGGAGRRSGDPDPAGVGLGRRRCEARPKAHPRRE